MKKMKKLKKEYKKLEKKTSLLLTRKLSLSCAKSKCSKYQVASECKICAKKHRCDTCKLLFQCSFTNCSKIQYLDKYLQKEEICKYISKKFVQSAQ